MWLCLSKKFLVLYYPLCMNKNGKEAISKYGYKPFTDHSIRREPSLESVYPAITSTCRGRNFAPRLRVNDTVVYLTKSGQYGDIEEEHYRLVAILKVIHRFDNHQSAANWYIEKGLPVPSNCIIPNNPPLDFDHSVHSEQDALFSEEEYNKRVLDNPDFLICEPLKLELDNPPIILKSELEDATGFTPTTLKGTQNPSYDNISENHLRILMGLF